MELTDRPEQALAGERMCGVQFQQHVNRTLSQLWRSQQLCDVKLQPCDGGEVLLAHRIVLASSSGFFRAVFCGAGQVMKEGAAADNSNTVVQLPYSRQQIADLLTMLYDYSIRVYASNVAWMLDMASYLEIQPLQEACCLFLQSALRPETCMDVLLIAHHYQCSSLQSEAVQYVAQHLASLLLLSEVRQGLCRLPAGLVQDVLGSEVLEVEQEGELLCFVSDWISANPQERLQHLPQLLSLLQLPVLPQEAPLSQQQLNACTSPAAAQLAVQLHGAAAQCQQQQELRLSCTADRFSSSSSSRDSSAVVPCIDPNNWASSGGSSSIPGPSPTSAALACSVSNSSSASGSVMCSSSSSECSTWLDEWLGSNDGVRSIGAVVVEAWPGRQRGYQATKLLVAGGHDLSWRGLKSTEMYDPRTDTWTSGPTLPAALPFAGAGLLSRGELYIVGGGMYSSLMARLDIGDGCWHTLEGPKTPRLHAAVTGSSGATNSSIGSSCTAAQLQWPPCQGAKGGMCYVSTVVQQISVTTSFVSSAFDHLQKGAALQSSFHF
eukprot:GHUV01014897.1.p1 GENE.GHUV01014897.1~~GHUV01014897.1.p1  ORF type:complete len:549 (+),score=161.79 GHUV01014897.1:230-1876(+)